jgi:hypothetical protein
MTTPVDAEADSNGQSFDIDDKKRIQVRTFNGKIFIDLREYFQRGDGAMAPTKKGISLGVDQWEKFLGYIEEVNKAIA